MDIDDPRTTAMRKQILETKPFLWRIYDEWYRLLADDLPEGNEPVLELGSGAGFLKSYVPDLLTSEIFACPGVDVVLDGQQMPLADASLRGVVMTDVFHHVPNTRRFLAEAGRCVRPGGVIAMIEPWYSKWSQLIYTRLHHEPFRPEALTWEFAPTGPLSGSNQALAWLVFHRDRAIFEHEFPQWRIETIRPFMPFRYLISGGVSMRSLAPAFSFAAIRALENLLGPVAAMFAHIVLRRR